MTTEHLLNLAIHVLAGTIGIAIGFTMLARAKGTPAHRRLGRIFCYFTIVVCVSATTGLIFFRFMPLFAVLTVLVLYQLVSGWHTAYTQERGPVFIDAAWTLLASLIFIFLAPIVIKETTGAHTVVYSSLGALATILTYDAMRWLFPRHWYGKLWRYEHSYKMIAPMFGMISAFVGNVVRFGQPWSQIVPSVVGLVVIIYFFHRQYREDRAILAP